jgi:hypothetical protein
VKRLAPLLLALVLALLSGCEGLNDALVRQWFKDSGLSRKVNEQIREGLERRKARPKDIPRTPAPDFLDQG